MTGKNDSGPRRIHRRRAIKTAAAAPLAGLAAAGAGRLLAAPETRGRPNMVFILSDDHRWDHFGFSGHPFIRTPVFDRLADEGVVFNNSFVTTSLCSPSRACFLTGNYPHTHGVKNNLTTWDNHNVTFLEMLKAAGYDTAFIGKWHMPGKLPELRGVDLFVTFTVQGGQGRYFDCPLIVNKEREPSRKPYITEELTDRAIEFMRKQRDNPFCLFLSHKAVHHQFLPPPDLKGIYDDAELNFPEEADRWITATNGHMFYGTLLPLSIHYRNYCAALTALDREVGRVLDHLDRAGIADDTVVVYTSDNGFFWGEHRLVDKRWAYEEAIRVPFIIRHPGLGEKGGRREQMILNVDLAPTMLDAAGLSAPKEMEGKSIMPLLRSADAPGREAWLYEYFRDYPYAVPGIRAVRTRTHKYIEYDNDRPAELFDLAADPREKNNLLGTLEGQKLRSPLKKKLEALKSGA